MSEIMDRLTDVAFLAACATAIAVTATILAIGLPLLERYDLNEKMRSVALERDRLRARERARLELDQVRARDRSLLQQENGSAPRISFRSSPSEIALYLVDRLQLRTWLNPSLGSERLAQAGLRGAKIEITVLAVRLIAPICLCIAAVLYLLAYNGFGLSMTMQAGIVIGAIFLGVKLPEIYLSNLTTKRQTSMRRAFPDALDLLLICVEAGMSIETAFRKVSAEIGPASIPMAEELALTTAELSYLPERRSAYENFAKRTGLDSVRSVTTALIQAERYGTPLGQALRVLAQESRDQRMTAAEKKAAALPPMLTVPAVLFFLPALFIVILTPAMIQVFQTI